ncbi:MAG: hypothetical protein HZC51_05040 [Nitrospirae bacterium]|nr:hypothetical protein [Nitrospirota bacterium]
MKRLVIALIIAVVVLDMGLIKDSSADITSVTSLMSTKDILAINKWDFSDADGKIHDTVCVVTRSDDVLSTGKISFYNRTDDNTLEKVYEYDPECYYYSMFALSNAGNLVTVWETGSAVHLTIFSMIHGKIVAVMDESMKGFPEIADIDNDGEFEIITTLDNFLTDYKTNKVVQLPEEADIYKWDGEKYFLLNIVPWKQRFKLLTDTIKKQK